MTATAPATQQLPASAQHLKIPIRARYDNSLRMRAHRWWRRIAVGSGRMPCVR